MRPFSRAWLSKHTEQFIGREGKKRTLFRLPACAVFRPALSQSFNAFRLITHCLIRPSRIIERILG